jgi:hypothetical protein
MHTPPPYAGYRLGNILIIHDGEDGSNIKLKAKTQGNYGLTRKIKGFILFAS